MPFRDLFRRYPQPQVHRIDQPEDASYDYKPHLVPTANEIYNNATPQWVWDRDRGGWSLVYTYRGYQFAAMPDQRIANSWYANYGADSAEGEEPEWGWVWDPNVRDWIHRPIGRQTFGTALGYAPAEQPHPATYTYSKSSGTSWYVGPKVIDRRRANGISPTNRMTWGSSGQSLKSRWNAFLGRASR